MWTMETKVLHNYEFSSVIYLLHLCMDMVCVCLPLTHTPPQKKKKNLL